MVHFGVLYIFQRWQALKCHRPGGAYHSLVTFDVMHTSAILLKHFLTS